MIWIWRSLTNSKAFQPCTTRCTHSQAGTARSADSATRRIWRRWISDCHGRGTCWSMAAAPRQRNLVGRTESTLKSGSSPWCTAASDSATMAAPGSATAALAHSPSTRAPRTPEPTTPTRPALPSRTSTPRDQKVHRRQKLTKRRRYRTHRLRPRRLTASASRSSTISSSTVGSISPTAKVATGKRRS